MKYNRLRLARWDVFHAAAKYEPRRNPILHVGAHYGEEKEEYRHIGFETVLWVEAQETAFAILKKNVGENYCLHAGMWSVSDLEIELHITNNSVSTSFYKLDSNNHLFDSIKEVSMIKVKTISLADTVDVFRSRGVLNEKFVLRLDVQGSEYAILKSSSSLLRDIDFICCEVTSKQQIYESTQPRKKIVLFLLSQFWIPAFSKMNPETSHGETIFIPIKRIGTFLIPIVYMRLISFIDNFRYKARKKLFRK